MWIKVIYAVVIFILDLQSKSLKINFICIGIRACTSNFILGWARSICSLTVSKINVTDRPNNFPFVFNF